MRQIERIPIFLNLVEGQMTTILDEIFNLQIPENQLDIIVDNIYDSWDFILNEWKNNPDWRFTQVLVNLEFIPNYPGMWYYTEESEILVSLGIDAREYLLWGKNYDKDMNRLPETQYALIKDLETDHIKSILDGGWCKAGPHFDCLSEELRIRENDINF